MSVSWNQFSVVCAMVWSSVLLTSMYVILHVLYITLYCIIILLYYCIIISAVLVDNLVLVHCLQFLCTAFHVSSYNKFHVQWLIKNILSYLILCRPNRLDIHSATIYLRCMFCLNNNSQVTRAHDLLFIIYYLFLLILWIAAMQDILQWYINIQCHVLWCIYRWIEFH